MQATLSDCCSVCLTFVSCRYAINNKVPLVSGLLEAGFGDFFLFNQAAIEMPILAGIVIPSIPGKICRELKKKVALRERKKKKRRWQHFF